MVGHLGDCQNVDALERIWREAISFLTLEDALMLSRREFGRLLGVMGASGALPALAQGRALTVVTWGGTTTRFQKLAVFDPFTAETGIPIKIEEWNGNLGLIRAQVESGKVTWDVVVGDIAFAKRGCEDGFLEKISPSILPAGGNRETASTDFLPGSIQECGIGAYAWSYVVAWDKRKFERINSIGDFFNLSTYPGKRGMRKAPQSSLEFALLGDGVSTDQVYKLLRTKEGVDRAFRKLDSIKSQIVWWESGGQARRNLADGEVVMSTGFGGSMVYAILDDKRPFGLLQGASIIDQDAWMVVKNAPNKDLAMRFIAFASRPDRMAALGSTSPNAPVRQSAFAMVTNHPTLGVDMKPYLATFPENRKSALLADTEFWSDRGDDLKERFNAWLSR